MFLYTAIEAIVAIVAGILIAACMKRADGVTCGIGLGLSVAFRKSGNWVLPCSLQVPEV